MHNPHTNATVRDINRPVRKYLYVQPIRVWAGPPDNRNAASPLPAQMTREGAAETKKETRVTAPHWTTMTYKRDAAFGERIFVNMPYRSHVERGNKLTMWISPLIGHEDEPGAWRFHARSGGAHLEEGETLDLLAGVFTLLAGHGYTPENLTFSTLAAIAQRPQHHIPATQREAAKRHIARQKQLGRGIERMR